MTRTLSPATYLYPEGIIAPGLYAASQQTSVSVLVGDFEWVMFEISAATVGSAFTSMQFDIEESDDGSSWTSVGSTITKGSAFVGTEGIVVRTAGKKKYLRLLVTPVGGTWTGDASAVRCGPSHSASVAANFTWLAEVA